MTTQQPTFPRCRHCRSRLNSWVVAVCMKCQLASNAELKFRERTGA